MGPRRLVLLASLIGVAFQLLFFREDLGLNVLLLTVATLGAGALARPPGARIHPADRWLIPAALFFAACLALRNEPTLRLFDIPATLVLLLGAAVALSGRAVTPHRALDIAWLGARAAGASTVRAAALLGEARPRIRRIEGALPVLRGLALAGPLLLAFTLLFISADAVFARTVNDAVDLRLWLERLGDLPGRAAYALAAGWLAAGGLHLVRRGLSGGRRAMERAARQAVEPLVALIAVDALFAFFAILQVAYLFGGRDTLEASGLTYSAYARRGFFELIVAAIGAGGIVLALEWLALRSRAIVAAELVLLALTGVVLASAAYRVQLYQAAYGWSELRFYALAEILWLAGCLLAAVPLLLRGAARWLPHAVIAVGLAVAAATNLLGPAEFSAQANVERYRHPETIPADGYRGLDVSYLLSLGDAGVPALLEVLPGLRGSERDLVACRLDSTAAPGDPASWNLQRERARQAVAARDDLPTCPWR